MQRHGYRHYHRHRGGVCNCYTDLDTWLCSVMLPTVRSTYKRSETRQGAGQDLARNGSFAGCQVSVAYRVLCPVVFCSVVLVIVVMAESLTEIERKRVSGKSGSNQFSRSMTSRLDGGFF